MAATKGKICRLQPRFSLVILLSLGKGCIEPSSFEESVRLFKSWGFVVKPGSRPGDVSLILEGANHRAYVVYKADTLPEIAAVTLRIRWQNEATINVSTTVAQPEHKPAFSALIFQERRLDLQD